jgi:hypothetical protein
MGAEEKSVWNKICCIFDILNEFKMKKLVYKIFGNPIAPTNTGLIGTRDGRLFIDKAVFFTRTDVQEVIKSVKESTVVKSQIKSQKLNY